MRYAGCAWVSITKLEATDCSGSLMGGGSALIVTIERAKRISQTPPERLKSEKVWAENGQNLVKCPMTLQMLG